MGADEKIREQAARSGFPLFAPGFGVTLISAGHLAPYFFIDYPIHRHPCIVQKRIYCCLAPSGGGDQFGIDGGGDHQLTQLERVIETRRAMELSESSAFQSAANTLVSTEVFIVRGVPSCIEGSPLVLSRPGNPMPRHFSNGSSFGRGANRDSFAVASNTNFRPGERPSAGGCREGW